MLHDACVSVTDDISQRGLTLCCLFIMEPSVTHHNIIPQPIQRNNVPSASSCVFDQTMQRDRCVHVSHSHPKQPIKLSLVITYKFTLLCFRYRVLFITFEWRNISCIILDVVNPPYRQKKQLITQKPAASVGKQEACCSISSNFTGHLCLRPAQL